MRTLDAFCGLAATVLLGCHHQVIDSGEPQTPSRRPALRRPLEASISSNNGTQTDDVARLLETSGYFASVRRSPSSADDVHFVFDGYVCEQTWTADAAVTMLGGFSQVVTLGLAPMPKWKESCAVKLTYVLARDAGKSGSYYPYTQKTYQTTLGWWIYSSAARDKYQRELLLDRAVDKLLADLGSKLTTMKWDGSR
jgi:hypothetical protein